MKVEEASGGQKVQVGSDNGSFVGQLMRVQSHPPRGCYEIHANE